MMIARNEGPCWYKDCPIMNGDFHHNDKTVVRPSYVYDGNSYTDKTRSLYWDSLRWIESYDIHIVFLQCSGHFSEDQY